MLVVLINAQQDQRTCPCVPRPLMLNVRFVDAWAHARVQDFNECRPVSQCEEGTVEEAPPTYFADRKCRADTFSCTDGIKAGSSGEQCSCGIDHCRSCTKQPSSESKYGAVVIGVSQHPQLATAIGPCEQLPLQGEAAVMDTVLPLCACVRRCARGGRPSLLLGLWRGSSPSSLSSSASWG